MSAAGKNELTRIQQYQDQSKLYCVTQNTLKNKKEKSPLQPTYFKSGSFTELPHKFKKKKTLDFHTIQITHKYSNAAS